MPDESSLPRRPLPPRSFLGGSYSYPESETPGWILTEIRHAYQIAPADNPEAFHTVRKSDGRIICNCRPFRRTPNQPCEHIQVLIAWHRVRTGRLLPCLFPWGPKRPVRSYRYPAWERSPQFFQINEFTDCWVVWDPFWRDHWRVRKEPGGRVGLCRCDDCTEEQLCSHQLAILEIIFDRWWYLELDESPPTWK